jgi:hypothetical protein
VKIILGLGPCLELLGPHAPISLFPSKTKQARDLLLVFSAVSHTQGFLLWHYSVLENHLNPDLSADVFDNPNENKNRYQLQQK